MKIKIIYVLLILSMIFLPFSHVLAAETTTTLEVVKNSSETKTITGNYGYIVKSIVDSKPDNGEVTIELKLSNTAVGEDGATIYDDTEMFLIVNETIVVDDEKFQKYIDDIENLSTKIAEANPKIKIGIIGIKGPVRDITVVGDNSYWGEDDEGEVPGSADNSEVVVAPTRDIEKIKSSLKAMNSDKKEYYSNLQAAIRLANNSFSQNVNKILICLYDNVPAVAIGVKSDVTYYNDAKSAVEEKHEKIATYTKNEILTLKESHTSFIMLRPPDTSYDEKWYSTTTGEKILDFDGSPYVQKLYGTVDNPTYGKMYEYTDENIDRIITEDIYKDVQEILQPDMKDVKIVDYFPADIVHNFEFEIAKEPSQGKISDKIDSEKDSIEWNVGDVNQKQMATVQYKLKLTDMNNEKIMDREVATNDKVVLTYTDTNGKSHEVNLTSSPIVKLTEEKPENPTQSPNPNPGGNSTGGEKEYEGKDPTVSPEILPKAGWEIKMMIVLMIITFSVATVTILYKKNKDYKDVK